LGERVNLGSLTHIFITHGHIDHYAGLDYIVPKTQAKIGVHELDYGTLTNYHERKDLVGRNLTRFLIEAGVAESRVIEIVNMYMITKGLFSRSRVDFTYEDIGMRVGPFEFLHVPGHSAGAVVIQLDNVVFAGDHVLSDITPHQAPESLTLNTGLSHYLDSLRSMLGWVKNYDIVLGGHNQWIDDLPKRIAEIYLEHKDRLTTILTMIEEKPRNTTEISKALFGRVHGYTILLALEETGAHIEYLYRFGFLSVDNLEEVKNSKSHVLRYRSLREKADLDRIYPKL
jgi:glyoxylase-like metal-dependent hydrolase (beta-lactamase superfamily II)